MADKKDLVPAPINLRERREALGLKQNELAYLSRVSDRTLSMIEAGRVTKTRRATAGKLETILNLSLNEIHSRLLGVRGQDSIKEMTTEELEFLIGVSQNSGGKLSMVVITELLLGRRANPPPPR